MRLEWIAERCRPFGSQWNGWSCSRHFSSLHPNRPSSLHEDISVPVPLACPAVRAPGFHIFTIDRASRGPGTSPENPATRPAKVVSPMKSSIRLAILAAVLALTAVGIFIFLDTRTADLPTVKPAATGSEESTRDGAANDAPGASATAMDPQRAPRIDPDVFRRIKPRAQTKARQLPGFPLRAGARRRSRVRHRVRMHRWRKVRPR